MLLAGGSWGSRSSQALGQLLWGMGVVVGGELRLTQEHLLGRTH